MPAPESPADWVATDWNGTVVPFFGKPAYPGALDLLHRLRGRGAALVVVSCARQGEIDADVARVGLEADAVIGCGDKGPVLAALADRLGPGTMLGDHPADQRAAHDAGLVFVQARLEGQPRLDGSAGCFESWPEAARTLRMLQASP